MFEERPRINNRAYGSCLLTLIGLIFFAACLASIPYFVNVDKCNMINSVSNNENYTITFNCTSSEFVLDSPKAIKTIYIYEHAPTKKAVIGFGIVGGFLIFGSFVYTIFVLCNRGRFDEF